MTEGLARAGFDIDLRHGQAREQALVNVFLRARVEVKSDSLCRETGNLVIEYKQKGRKSGISVTTADWWAFEYHDEQWLIVTVDRVKALARRAIREGRTRKGGDHNLYDLALVPVEWFNETKRYEDSLLETLPEQGEVAAGNFDTPATEEREAA